MQLQQSLDRFRQQGLGLAAISYDTPDVLRRFSDRQHITFPLLADPDVEIIRLFHVLNPERFWPHAAQGLAYPGFIYIDASGRIREKLFETDYKERYTANNLISKLFPELTEQIPRKVATPRLGLTLQQSDAAVFPGSRVTLIVEGELAPGVHVYAPDTKGYIPIEFALQSGPDFKIDRVVYPKSEMLYILPIKEKVPVFSGKFRITRDVTISADDSLKSSLGPDGKALTIKGSLKYQACDDKTCFTPVTTPLEWSFLVVPLKNR